MYTRDQKEDEIPTAVFTDHFQITEKVGSGKPQNKQPKKMAIKPAIKPSIWFQLFLEILIRET